MVRYHEVDVVKLITAMDGAFDAYMHSTVKDPDPKVDVAMLILNAHTEALKKLVA